MCLKTKVRLFHKKIGLFINQREVTILVPDKNIDNFDE